MEMKYISKTKLTIWIQISRGINNFKCK